MSLNRLSPKTCRRLSRLTGLDLTRGWANGFRYGAFTHQVRDTDETMWVIDPHTGHFALLHELRALEQERLRVRLLRKQQIVDRLYASLGMTAP